ncbi:MAG: MFS transporter [Cellulomonadaceae bacterium]|jgi:MFS family permease|nr:MFS transporter [Cellulomonadaceae bacterium]
MEIYDAPLFPLRTVILGAFVPTFLFSSGVGALIPIIPTRATTLGASLATAGLITALLAVGTIVADLPAGSLASRIGDSRAMIVAGVVAAGAFAAAALIPHIVALSIAALVLGGAGAIFGLARHSYLTEVTPPLRRARVLSTLGGVHRVGNFVGPFVGAFLVARWPLESAMWLGVVVSLAAAVTVLIAGTDDETTRAIEQPHLAARQGDAPAVTVTLRSVVREHLPLFATLGMCCLLVGAVRGARDTVLPLWGEHLGLDAHVISLVFGIAGAFDLLLFYPAGKMMDKRGRNWIAIPSMVVMGVALLLIPFTHAVPTFAAAAIVLGIGNGIGSGVLMTLGADASPAHGRPQFLSLWRLMQDTGSALGPLILSAGAALGSLAAGIWTAGLLSPTAAVALARFVPRWTVHANRTTRRQAGIEV